MEQNRGGHLKAFLLLAAAALLLFAEAVFTDGLPFPAHTDAFRPWSDDLTPDELTDVHQKMNRSATDKNFSFHPDNLVTSEAFQNGRLPLWNPYQAGGLPHVGQSLYGIFYPLNLPLFLSGSESCYLWLAALHYLMAGFFTYLLLRRFGLSFQAAFFGGLIFMCSATMTARFHYYMTVYPMAWTPLMLFLVDRFHRDRSWLSLCGLSLLSAMIVLSGFQQVAIYVIYLCLIFSLFYTARDRYRLKVKRGLLVVAAVTVVGFAVVVAGLKPLSEHPTGVYSIAVLLCVVGFLAAGEGFFRWIVASLPVLCALALGVGLSAVQMVPVLTLMDFSTRTQLGAEQIVRERSLHGARWLGFLLPALLDDPMWAFTTTQQNFIGTALTGSPDQLIYMENNLYLGIIPLALIGCLGFGKKGNGLVLLLAILCLFILSLAFGLWFIVYPMWWIPGFRLDPRRTLLIFTFLASLLAAFSFDRIRKDQAESAKPMFFSGLLLAIAVVSGVAGAFFNDSIAVLFRNQAAGDPRTAEAAASGVNGEWILGENARQIRFALLHLALASALGGTALLRHALRPGRMAFCFMVFALLVDLVPLSWHVNGTQNPDGFLKAHPALEVMRPGSESDHFRIFRYGETTSDSIRVPLPGNMATHFGIEDGECYSVQTLKRYFRLVNTVQPAPPIAGQGVWILPISVPDALRSPVLDLVGVRFLLATKKVPEGMGFEEVYTRKGLHVYRNTEAFPRAFMVPEATFFDPDRYRDSRSSMKKALDEHVLMLNPDPESWAHILRAMFKPGIDLRSKVFIEAAPFEWDRDEGPLPNAMVRYPCPEEVEITFDGPNPGGVLVLTDAYYPGWKAEVDGTRAEVMPADLAFRAVAVPRGSKKVVFRFDPPDVKKGIIITLLSILILVAGTALFIIRRRRTGKAVPKKSPHP